MDHALISIGKFNKQILLQIALQYYGEPLMVMNVFKIILVDSGCKYVLLVLLLPTHILYKLYI